MDDRSETKGGLPRTIVVAALFLLSLITYIDRSAISSAKGPMAK
jgi:hypothetical protein